jgi:hypothetical protein
MKESQATAVLLYCAEHESKESIIRAFASALSDRNWMDVHWGRVARTIEKRWDGAYEEIKACAWQAFQGRARLAA